jgi:hypothetical protein
MLPIQTFDARAGGNVLYKALAHPLAAEGLARLAATLGAGPVALYDPDGVAEALLALAPALPRPAAVYVSDVDQVGRARAGLVTEPLTDLPRTAARAVLIAQFDAQRVRDRVAGLVPEGVAVLTLDEARLPERLLTNPRRYLDRLNFATNFAFFRDEGGLSTRLVTANYWAGYGAKGVRLWLRLYGANGGVLAEWEEAVPDTAAGICLDSREVRARFGLPAFTGQLFVHAVGVAGHDVVKYALDTYGDGDDPSLSCTHDANAWPSSRYAGLPAPKPGERVILWLQNSHAAPIPPGDVAFDRMGAERPVTLAEPLAPFASRAVDVAEVLPGVVWPAQVELRAGRHMVRPRYEVVEAGRTRIAHVNVERADLSPESAIKSLSPLLGRGFLLPFPILPRGEFRTIALPTPMAETQRDLPLRLDVFGSEGRALAGHFLGCLPRDHALAFDLDALNLDLGNAGYGHAELVYDFRDGGEADGWMHVLARYERRDALAPHAAETSFGAHIFNTAMTWRDEPQSYNGPPPGLSTRLFLRLGDEGRRAFTHLIYPASHAWHPRSATRLELHDGAGRVLAERPLAIACSGSALVFPDVVFEAEAMREAGPRGYVLIRDATCRLFGYHGLMDGAGGFSLDHMFGF